MGLRSHQANLLLIKVKPKLQGNHLRFPLVGELGRPNLLPFCVPPTPAKVESQDADLVTACMLREILLIGAISHPSLSKQGFSCTEDCLHQGHNISSKIPKLFCT